MKFVAASALALGCAFLCAFAQTGKKNLASVLGKDFAAYDALLGKPVKTEAPTDEFPAETRHYRTTFADQVLVTKAGDASTPGYVSVIFKKGSVKTWKEALAKVGLNGSKAKAKSQDGYLLLTQVSGLKPGWTHVTWIPKSPDADGKDNLQISK